MSPDGSRLVVEVDEDGREHLWVIELKSGSASAITSTGTGNVFAAWSPDGQSVVYRSNQSGGFGIYRLALDGRGGPQVIFPSPEEVMPGSVSPGGTLVFAAGDYLRRQGFALPKPAFLDTVPIRFGMAEPTHYHVPLLVSPYGYSTYRGS